MSALSDLKAEAKKAGIKGYTTLSQTQLEAALGYTITAEFEPEKATEGPLIGVPTKSDAWIAANLTEAELESAIIASPVAEGGKVVKNLGVPTEPEKAGIFPTPEPAPQPPKAPPPSHSGADIEAGIGIPTEPDRGGLNPTEVKLSGAVGNTAAGKKAAAQKAAGEKAAKKAAKEAAKKAPKAEAKAEPKTTKKAANKTT